MVAIAIAIGIAIAVVAAIGIGIGTAIATAAAVPAKEVVPPPFRNRNHCRIHNRDEIPMPSTSARGSENERESAEPYRRSRRRGSAPGVVASWRISDASFRRSTRISARQGFHRFGRFPLESGPPAPRRTNVYIDRKGGPRRNRWGERRTVATGRDIAGDGTPFRGGEPTMRPRRRPSTPTTTATTGANVTSCRGRRHDGVFGGSNDVNACRMKALLLAARVRFVRWIRGGDHRGRSSLWVEFLGQSE
mmetsp:Transcript_18609/g.39117  ORF Transcript_18609/g.39117 Transcript_18609/m.39117 type:complete len:248 (-) Transcript_18609:267-1010(-)